MALFHLAVLTVLVLVMVSRNGGWGKAWIVCVLGGAGAFVVSNLVSVRCWSVPCVGIGHAALRGWQFSDVGMEFIYRNCAGLVACVLTYVASAFLLRIRSVFVLMKIVVCVTVVYCLCCCFFLWDGAYAHGCTLPTGSSRDGCVDQMNNVKWALVDLVLDRGSRIPDVKDSIALYKEISREGILEGPDAGSTVFCPWGRVLEREPKPYVWNAEFGGKAWGDIPEGSVLLKCPYHDDLEYHAIVIHRDGAAQKLTHPGGEH